MIENYAAKKKAGSVQLEYGEDGQIVILERGFDPSTGVPVIKETQRTNTKHIRDLIADCEKQMEPIKARIADLKALLPDVKNMEASLIAKEAAVIAKPRKRKQ